MNFYERVVETLNQFKKDGITKNDALSCLEFDSDEYPDAQVLNQALEKVYGDDHE